ncbi:MAG TPA: hypothetical protein VGO15_08140, partial [Candidatus Limnocylindrales bacterium]|nr:hypothetical protein [Candidatus Limnocylindrales bacterium]
MCVWLAYAGPLDTEIRGSLLPSLGLIVGELAISVSDTRLWLAAGEALILACVCLLLGIWVSRKVGLLASDAPASETIGVGLASGLAVLTVGWAALRSGGQSAFTPVAFGFASATVLAVVGWRRNSVTKQRAEVALTAGSGRGSETRPPGTKRLVLASIAGAVFIVAFGFLFGATMAQSPRDGVQPVEFMDEAFYAVLGDDLAKTGVETIYSPAGVGDLPDLPSQTWYHWGELWFASAAVALFGTEPMFARFAIVLPILLLAAASLTGTLVRRVTGTSSLGAYVFGFGACLFLAPLPLVAGVFFGSWAVGMLFGITLYGLAAVVALLAMYSFVVRPPR